MEESYVSLDTTRMLKEAGFEEPCKCMYDLSPNREYKLYQNLIGDYMVGENYYSQTYILAPSQALAARWILEAHGIFIEDYILVNGMFSYRLFRNGRNMVSEQSDMYESLQECVEDALQEALRLIIKNKDNEQRN